MTPEQMLELKVFFQTVMNQRSNTIVAEVRANASAVPSAVLNATFKTSTGAVVNIPGMLDAINTKPAGVVTLTPEQLDQMVASLKIDLPPATLAALAAKLAS